MVNILPIDADVRKDVDRHNLRKKFEKQIGILGQNPKHPSLHVELLEPKTKGIWSFRLDRKYRALVLVHAGDGAIEILAITVHYQ